MTQTPLKLIIYHGLYRVNIFKIFLSLFLGPLVLSGQVTKYEFENYSSVEKQFSEINYTQLSDSAKSIYWLNRFHLDNHQLQDDQLEFEKAFEIYLDSSWQFASKSNCASCKAYWQLLKINYYPYDTIALPLPKFPKNGSKTLRLHFLVTKFLVDFNQGFPLDESEIEEIESLSFNSEIPVLQRVVVCDLMATYYYFQKEDYQTCERLFKVAIEAYENEQFEYDPWHIQIENPGIYHNPIQKVSRGYLNSGLVADKLGNYDKAIKYRIKGAELYSLRKDTLGLLWAFRDLSKAFAYQSDLKNSAKYIDSTLQIIDVASFRIMKSQSFRVSEFLLNYYGLLQNPTIKNSLGDQLKSAISKLDPFGSTEDNRAYQAHIELFKITEIDSLLSKNSLNRIEGLIEQLKADSTLIFVFDQNLKSLILAQFWTLKALTSENLKEKNNARQEYKAHWREINIDLYHQNYYTFFKKYFKKLNDQSFFLEMNQKLMHAQGEESAAKLDFVSDRYAAWEDLNQYDSALFYHKIYSALKDSIINRDNYIKLAQSDIALKSLETQRASNELKLESLTNKQRFLLSGILAVTFLFLAILFQQKRKREKIKNEKNAELLELRAETEAQKNQILKGQNKKLEKELHTSILETIHNQTRTIELGELIEELKSGSESIFVERKAKEMKRKLDEFSAEEALIDIEKSAAQLSPKLYDFLMERLSKRNKMELMLCLMLVMNYSSDDIARLLNRSDKAVKSLRYRVRKRLELEENQDLKEYLKQYSDQKIEPLSN